MGKSLSMEYTTMEQEIKNLKKASAAFDTTAQNMSTAVGNLCEHGQQMPVQFIKPIMISLKRTSIKPVG